MASAGQKHGSSEHVMAMFNQHSPCTWCCNKGVGSDPCVLKTVLQCPY